MTKMILQSKKITSHNQAFFHLLTYFVAFILLATVSNCVRFKIDELSPSKEFSLPFGSKPGQFKSKFRDGFPQNLPEEIFSSSDYYFVPSLNDAQVKILKKDGSLHMLLGVVPKLEKNETRPYTMVHFPFSQVVRIIPTDNDTFYVQNRIIPKTDSSAAADDLIQLVPLSSYILHFNLDGKLLATIGQNGNNSTPFGYIERILVDQQNRLIVQHQNALEKVIALYSKNGKMISEINESDMNIPTSEEDSSYASDIENIVPFPGGESYLVSVGYRDKGQKSEIRYRLKYRKIIRFDLKSPKSGTVLLEITDPRETLFWTNKAGGFYIWQNENTSNTIRLQVYDNEGNHINNKLIRLEGARTFWRQIYADLDDNIYSLYSDSKTLDIYHWN